MPKGLSKSTNGYIPIWTEEEKIAEFHRLFKNMDIFWPDDFYNAAMCSEDLELMIEKLRLHLKMKAVKLSVIFSDQLGQSGYYEPLSDKKAVLIVNARYTGDAYASGAIIAHNLCQYLLIEQHGIRFRDKGENDKAADMATIHSGLGIVVMNGAVPSGWRSIFKNLRYRIFHPYIGTTYYPPRDYAGFLMTYLQERRVQTEDAFSYIVPWAHKLISKRRYTASAQLDFIAEARRKHRRSLRNFGLSVVISSVFLGLGAYVAARNPAFLSSDLRAQERKVKELRVAYEGCLGLVERVYQDYDETDASVQRYIDGEQTQCRSLQNRYNYEVEIYNMILQGYDRI